MHLNTPMNLNIDYHRILVHAVSITRLHNRTQCEDRPVLQITICVGSHESGNEDSFMIVYNGATHRHCVTSHKDGTTHTFPDTELFKFLVQQDIVLISIGSIDPQFEEYTNTPLYRKDQHRSDVNVSSSTIKRILQKMFPRRTTRDLEASGAISSLLHHSK